MPKFYCFKCGSGTDYTYNKPKVCLKCGNHFIESAVADYKKKLDQSVAQKVIEPKVNYEEPAVIDDDEYQETPHISLASFLDDVEVNRNCQTLVLQKPKKNSPAKVPTKRGRTKKSE